MLKTYLQNIFKFVVFLLFIVFIALTSLLVAPFVKLKTYTSGRIVNFTSVTKDESDLVEGTSLTSPGILGANIGVFQMLYIGNYPLKVYENYKNVEAKDEIKYVGSKSRKVFDNEIKATFSKFIENLKNKEIGEANNFLVDKITEVNIDSNSKLEN